MTASLLDRPFVRFLLVGGFAATVNILARLAFDIVVGYELAIVLAFLVGLTTAFTLNRAFVFETNGGAAGQYVRFALVNAFALVQVWLVSVTLAWWVFPALNFHWHDKTVAHIIGVLSPVMTSYFAHKYYTFSDQSADISKNIAKFSLLFFIFAAVLITKMEPMRLDPIAFGLDPSWIAALSEAHHKGWRFGTEIAFTGGPWSTLYTRTFQEGLAVPVVVVSFLMAAFLALALTLIALATGSVLAATFIVLVVSVTILHADALLLSLPFLMVVSALNRPSEPAWLPALLGIPISAAASLAKFSVFPILLLGCIILDVNALIHRRWPVHSIIAVVSLIVLFAIAGQDPSDLLTFLRSSIEVSSAYSAAMSIPGRTLEWIIWLAMATVLILALAGDVLAATRSSLRMIAPPIGRLLIFSGLLYVGFKAGFVRHDLHSLIAWSSLVIAFLIYGAIQWPLAAARQKALFMFAAAVVAAIPAFVLISRSGKTLHLPDAVAGMRSLSKQLTSAASLVLTPESWIRAQQSAYAGAKEAVRLQYLLPALEGSVDAIPSIQSSLIANGLDYQARPTIQEYVTFSSSLIARNRQFFLGTRAPRHIMMAPGSIDHRHPASAEGALWPLFLSHYEPAQRAQDLVILTRRPVPLENLLGAPIEASTHFRQEILLPQGTDPVLLKADIRTRLVGRFLDFAFKPPAITMVVRYSDNSLQSYAIVPAMIREGMVISPLVAKASDYLMLAAGRMDAPQWRRPIGIRFESGTLEAVAYERQIGVSFVPLRAAILREASNDSALVRSETKRLDDLAMLLTSNPLRPPTFDMIEEGLLAHAPMALRLPVTPGARLRLAFGMRNGSWQGNAATDGVCFAAKTSNGSALFERCLDPKTTPADRGPQEAIVTVPDGITSLSLETACRAHCVWDWSYWQAAAPVTP
jgi:putative flippase GtrA